MDAVNVFIALSYLLLLQTMAYDIPPNPCPSMLSYHRNGSFIEGHLTLDNDYSGDYKMSINASMIYQGNVDETKMTVLIADHDKITKQSSETITYIISFPSEIGFPKINSVIFNRNEYCSSSPYVPEPGTAVRYLFYELWLMSSALERKPDNRGTTNQFPSAKPQTVAVPIRQPLPSFVPPSVSPSPLVNVEDINNVWLNEIGGFKPTAVPQTLNDKCGKVSDAVRLVVSDVLVQDGELPWMAALYYFNEVTRRYEYRCTANLISEEHVLTAAFCVDSRTTNTSNLFLVLGKVSLQNWASDSTLAFIDKIDLHPKYAEQPSNNVAVIKLNKKVQLSYKIQPVCLPGPEQNLEELIKTGGTVAGWGISSRSETLSSGVARKTQISVVTQEACLRSNAIYRSITSSNTFCGVGKAANTGACSGDGGSGLFVKSKDRMYLRGLVIVGLSKDGFCSLDSYTVFVDVAQTYNWIKQIMT